MARPFFPEPHTSRPAAPTSPPPRERAGGRIALAAAGAAVTGLAGAFALLWLHARETAGLLEESRAALQEELARTSGEVSKQRRVLTVAYSESGSRLAAVAAEAGDLKKKLQDAQARLDEVTQWAEQVEAAAQDAGTNAQYAEQNLAAERARSAQLEANLAETWNDLSNRAAAWEDDASALQTTIVSLREEVSVRDVTVRRIVSDAERQIQVVHTHAVEMEQEALHLEEELRRVCQERDSLRTEVSRLQSCLQAAEAENHRLRCRVTELECEVRRLTAELANQPPPAGHPGAGSGGGAAAPEVKP